MLKILLVEDEASWQQILLDRLRRALQRLGHPDDTVQLASSFDTGMQALSSGNHWDLLVTDLGLPSNVQKLGKELVDRACGLSIPVIVVSGVADAMEVRDFLQKRKIADFFPRKDFSTTLTISS